ncbi:MAG: ribonuclease P protein component 4 [Thermoplasmata archaeon]
MSGPPTSARRGRRGRRTATMIRIAGERVQDLFGLAEAESHRPDGPLPHQYVALARKIGMRYNVRLAHELRDLYCRGCSVYWVEGRTVRTRLRLGRRVRTCLRCGRVRRVPLRRGHARHAPIPTALRPTREADAALAEEVGEGPLENDVDEQEDA